MWKAIRGRSFFFFFFCGRPPIISQSISEDVRRRQDRMGRALLGGKEEATKAVLEKKGRTKARASLSHRHHHHRHTTITITTTITIAITIVTTTNLYV